MAANSTFDLRPLLPSRARLLRRKEWFLLGMAALSVVFWALSVRTLVLSHDFTPGFFFATAFFLGLAAFFGLAIPVSLAYSGSPIGISIEPQGIRLRFEPPRERVLLWKDAKQWFELVDLREPARSEPSYGRPSAFYLFAPGRLMSDTVWLPEDAAGTILSMAKGAGLTINSQVWYGFRHYPRGSVIYTDSRRRYLG